MKSSKTSRIAAIDAARGTAMLFVCLSHFGIDFLHGPDAERTKTAIALVSKIATPTFMIISGIMLGYIFHRKRSAFDKLYATLVDRGLFFLVVGHALITVAYSTIRGSAALAFRALFITDVIGLCLITVPLLMKALRPASRLALGMLGYVLSWAVIVNWFPSGMPSRLGKNILFGILDGRDTRVLWDSFSFIPWLSLYLCFTVAGERMASLATGDHQHELERFVGGLAALFLACALSFLALWKALKHWSVISTPQGLRLSWLTIYQKAPPGPVHVLFYGGIGLAILFLLLRHAAHPVVRHYSVLAAVVGQVSFFTYILQYFVYEQFLYSLHKTFTYAWPLYFALSVAFIGAVAHQWHRLQLNRFLSFRYLWRQISGALNPSSGTS